MSDNLPDMRLIVRYVAINALMVLLVGLIALIADYNAAYGLVGLLLTHLWVIWLIST